MHNHGDLEKMKLAIKNEIMGEIQPMLQDLGKNMLEIKMTLAPMAEMFKSAQGFNSVGKWLIVTIIKIGAAVTVLYALIKWLKQ